MEPEKTTDPAALAAKDRFDPDRMTPQEIADTAKLHINTVKKILSAVHVHRNSVTKFNRAVDSLLERPTADVIELGFQQAAPAITPETLSKTLRTLVNEFIDFSRDHASNQSQLKKFDVDRLRADIAILQGTLSAIELGQGKKRN